MPLGLWSYSDMGAVLRCYSGYGRRFALWIGLDRKNSVIRKLFTREYSMVDDKTVELTHQYCVQRLGQHGYIRLILIGSRARGTDKPTSDHDFVAVVSDEAPGDVLDGRNTRLQFDFAGYVSDNGLKKVDLFVSTASRVAMPNPTPDDIVPYSCQKDGNVVRENT
jgi:predicted nucleotidyltransferase